MSTEKTGTLWVPGFYGMLGVREDNATVTLGGTEMTVSALSNVAGEFNQFVPATGKVLTLSNTGTIAGGDAWSLAIAAAKTFTVSNTLTLAGTDATVMTFPTTTATIARTDAAQTFTGAQTFGTMPIIPTATVAATGTNQATAAAITTGFTLVTAADGTVGVKLPTASAGLVCIVKSSVSNQILKVYPFSGDAINALAADGAISLASGPTIAAFFAYDTTTWYTLPLLPS